MAILGAVAMKVADVPTILAQHGFPPDADVETLLAALEERGWRGTVEETRVGAVRRYTAQAAHRHGGGLLLDSARATGPTSAATLGLVLAKILEKEGKA